jgi:hypothetical protein
VLNQANPVSGTPYPVLAATEDVMIISIVASVTWTVQPSPIETHVLLDGETITHTQPNPVSGIRYYAVIAPESDETTQGLDLFDDMNFNAYHREYVHLGQSAAITAETTGGTVSNLSCRVKWARLLPT